MARKDRSSTENKGPRPTMKSTKKAFRIFQFARPYRLVFSIGFLFLILSSFSMMLFPFLIGKLFGNNEMTESEQFIGSFDLSNSNHVAILLVIVFFAQAIFSFFRIYLFSYVTENTLTSIRKAVYGHLIHLPISFYHKSKVGDLSSRLATDITLLQETFQTTIAEFIRQFITIIIGCIGLFYLSTELALYMIAVIPVVAISAIIFGKFIKKLSKQAQSAASDSNVIVEESLMGIANVKAFTNEIFEVIRYQKSIDEVKFLTIKNGRWRGAFVSFIIFTMFSTVTFIIWKGASILDNESLTTFLLFTVFLGASFAGLPELFAKIQKAIGATEHLMDLLSIEKEVINENPTAITLNGAVEWNQVSFAYPSRKESIVLSDISFSVKPGQTVAIVGPSGAGKSTLATLLMRFYSPDSGSINYDNQDAQNFDLSALRSQLGVVPQEVFLFGGSIRENIAYGLPSASEEQIIEAAKLANAYDFIQGFPEQFDTQVGDRGIQLSGGQKQRVAIARAILKNPSILILDEATSALDSESELQIQNAFDDIMKSRTSFVIAHRLSTVRNADLILVLDKGKLIEKGTHEELSNQSGSVYKHLSELQLKK